MQRGGLGLSHEQAIERVTVNRGKRCPPMTWMARTGSSVNPLAVMLLTIPAMGASSFPSAILMHASQMDAALTYTSSAVDTNSRVCGQSRGELATAHRYI